ncbi:MAG: radical SAM protein [Selenomonadaceae bacterium]|nr:radical SAM protein [Selenomonadaceae bacterium]
MRCDDLLKVYRRGDKFLVLNPTVPSWVVTNANGVLLIKIFSETLSTQETLRVTRRKKIPDRNVVKFLDAVTREELFAVPSVPDRKPYQLRAVYLNMTERCNLNCVYCFAAARVESFERLTFNDYKKILDAVQRYNPRAEIIFTGGEPLMSPLTLPVAEYAKNLGFKRKLMTNATLIDEKNISALVDTFDEFKISVDGSDASKHDFYRGQGNFARTIKAVELLDKFSADVKFAMVVTKKNIDDVAPAAKIFGGRLTFQPLFPFGNAKTKSDLHLTGGEYFSALKSAGVVPFMDLPNVLKAHGKKIFKCALGDAEVSISCSGDFYPCQLLHHDEFKIGNVKNSSFDALYNSARAEKFKNHTVDAIDGCRDCDLKFLCGGACQARHFSETGSLDKAGDFCEYERTAIVDGLISAAELKAI